MGRKSNRHRNKTKPSASQSPDTKVIKQFTGKSIPSDHDKTVEQWIWSWPVIGVVIGIMLGGGITFMTSGSPYIADAFFITSGVVFLAKFLTWKSIRQHSRKLLFQGVAILFTLFVIVFAVSGNHYLNKKKHTRAFLQIDKPHIVELPEYSTIGVGEKLGFNIAMHNTSSERLFKIAGGKKMYIIEHPDSYSDKNIIELGRKEQKVFNQKYESGEITGRAEMGKSNMWGTVWTEPLSEKQCTGLLDGSTRIYIVTWGAWHDAEDNIDTAFSCEWLQALPPKPLGSTYFTRDLVWHPCQ